MRNNFNELFKGALANKMALQEAKMGQLNADAELKGQQSRYHGLDVKSGAGLRGAQAGLYGEQARLFEDKTNSAIDLQDSQGRLADSSANVNTGTFLTKLDNPGFNAGDYGSFSNNYAPEEDEYSTIGGTTDPYDTSRGGMRRDIKYEETYGSRGGGIQERAEGGLIEPMGYAIGGMVQGAPDSSMADYQEYLKASKNADVTAIPMADFMKQIAATKAKKRGEIMNLVTQGGTVPPAQGYASGGEIEGPGTGKSDSIPAVVDGSGPAAVSNGEFHIPKHVVEYFGTKMFDGLVAKAKQADKNNARNPNYRCGGTVQKH